MKKIILYLALALLTSNAMLANTVFSKDGIKLSYDIEKVKTVFVPSLNKKVIIWKSIIELANTNNKPVAVTSPCCLYYAFCFLFPNEISAVQSTVPDIKISDIYKTFATPKPTMLHAKQKVTNERYFATYEDVDLHDATYNLEVKYSF